MPNWCNNSITIEGDETVIAQLYSKVVAVEEADDKDENRYGIFRTLIGLPEGMTEERYQTEWYGTNVEYWGTKWDVYSGDFSASAEGTHMSISMSTAWSPPVAFCAELAKRYGVAVRIEYSEPGNDFAGFNEFDSTGEEVDNGEWGYLEGIYIMDKYNFWEEVESQIEMGGEDYLKDLEFLTDSERVELDELIAQYNSDNAE